MYRNQKLRISQQEDEIAFHKMADTPVSGRTGMTGGVDQHHDVVVDEKGKRGFATIDTKDLDALPDGDDVEDGDTSGITR